MNFIFYAECILTYLKLTIKMKNEELRIKNEELRITSHTQPRQQILHSSFFTLHFIIYLCTRKAILC